MSASIHMGMGSTPFDGGVAFRIWAPHATSVSVVGTFNDWNTHSSPMTAEGNGYWSTDVPGAMTGSRYKYWLCSPHLAEPVRRNDPWAVMVTHSAGESVVTECDVAGITSGYVTPSKSETILYELHVGTFNVDPSYRNGRGNFDTVIAKLDYLRDLGVNAIELMPTDEFPGDVSWGYNPSYSYAIEESYGGPAGLARLIEAAHSHGIAVIMDVVFNHLGPADLDLWRFDGWHENDGGGIYFYNDWRAETPWGHTRPDYGRGEVRSYLHDAAMRWLEERGCDGLRWDGTGWIRNVRGNEGGPDTAIPEGWSLFQWVNGDIAQRQPWKLSIAEDMSGDLALTKPVSEGGAGFDAQWDAGFMHRVREAVVPVDDAAREMEAIASVLSLRNGERAFSRVLFTESHDEVATASGQFRLPERVSPGSGEDKWAQKRSTLAAALMFTAPGIPMLFMGREFLETGGWSDTRGLDWTRLERFGGIHAFYRDLMHLRRNWAGNTAGLSGDHVNVFHVNHDEKLIAFHRWRDDGPGDDVVVVANFSSSEFDAYEIGFPVEGLWHVRFNGDWRGYSDKFDGQSTSDLQSDTRGRDGLPVDCAISIGPYSIVVLSQDRP